MPNIAAPFGLRPVGGMNGAPYSGRVTRYWIPSTDNNAYYLNDAVKSLANSDGTGVPGVVKITNGTDTGRGVIASIEPANVGFPGSMATLQGLDLGLSQVSIPASKAHDYYVYVADDPDMLMFIQGDTTGTNQVATAANKNASFTVAAPTPATYPVSATVLNSGSIATTQALNLRLIGLAQIPNNLFGASAIWVCKWNQHELMGNVAGI